MRKTTAIALAVILICLTAPMKASASRHNDISVSELNLLARLTDAEAGNQSKLGQRLVIDTVLNRVDDARFPDTITAVIYQRNQFSPVQSGSIWRRQIKPEIVELIREELEHRASDRVIFFRTQRYSAYGKPLFKVGDHYFSSYDQEESS